MTGGFLFLVVTDNIYYDILFLGFHSSVPSFKAFVVVRLLLKIICESFNRRKIRFNQLIWNFDIIIRTILLVYDGQQTIRKHVEYSKWCEWSIDADDIKWESLATQQSKLVRKVVVGSRKRKRSNEQDSATMLRNALPTAATTVNACAAVEFVLKLVGYAERRRRPNYTNNIHNRQ